MQRRLQFAALTFASLSAVFAGAQNPAAPERAKSTTYSIRQTVTLKEIPAGAKQVRAWIALPCDSTDQKVVDFDGKELPGTWRLTTEPEHGNRFLYVEAAPQGDVMTFPIDVVVRRDQVNMALDPSRAGKLTDSHRKLFARELDLKAPNMEVDAKIRKLADDACGGDDNVVSQARSLLHMVADAADHYSKDASKPKCGRGNAEDCMKQGGGCCTDLHSLYVAAARARGIPARVVFGYRVLDKNLGKEVDPGYRCWVEFFAPGYGWAPLDVVEADALDKGMRETWFGALSEQRVLCCEGRNFKLDPPQAGDRVNNMTIGYVEIDGKPVPVLPGADGKPSPLSRTVKFVKTERAAAGAMR